MKSMKPKEQTSRKRGLTEGKAKVSGSFKNRGAKSPPISGGAKYTNGGK